MLTGILLSLAVGFLWSFVGVFYKFMAKYRLSVFNISLVCNTFSLIVMPIFVTKTGAFISGEIPLPPLNYVFFMIAASFIDMAGSLLMQRSMIYGNSGVTWAISQSSLIVSFLAITVIFKEPLTWVKIVGTLVVILGMASLSFKPGEMSVNAPRPKLGITIAFIAFAVLGISHTMFSTTSFVKYQDVGEIRPLLSTFGCILATTSAKFITKDYGFKLDKKALLIIAAQAVNGFLAAWTLYNAMDALQKCNMNGLFYPISTGTCIAIYATISVLFFKEKCTKFLIAGIVSIVVGIAIYCTTLLH